MDRFYFHDGCTGCTRWQGNCPKCQFFECDWDLPNLNPIEEERERQCQAARIRCRQMAKEGKRDQGIDEKTMNKFDKLTNRAGIAAVIFAAAYFGGHIIWVIVR